MSTADMIDRDKRSIVEKESIRLICIRKQLRMSDRTHARDKRCDRTRDGSKAAAYYRFMHKSGR